MPSFTPHLPPTATAAQAEAVWPLHPAGARRTTLIAARAGARPALLAIRASTCPTLELLERSASAVVDGEQHSIHLRGRWPLSRVGATSPVRLEPVAWCDPEIDPLAGVDERSPLRVSITDPHSGERLDVAVDPVPGGALSDWFSPARPGLGWSRVRTSSATATVSITGSALDLDGAGEPWLALVRSERGTTALSGLDQLGAPHHTLPQCAVFQVHVLGATEDLGGTIWTWAADPEGNLVAGAPPPGVGVPTWVPGSRWPASLSLGGKDLAVAARLLSRGTGPTDPTWGAGTWHDELAVGTDRWCVPDLDPTAVENLQTISLLVDPVTDDPIAVLESLILGPFAPAGLTGFTDGVTPDAERP